MIEPGSSNGFRNAIFSRHDTLRDLLAETIDLAGAPSRAETALELLRARAKRLYLAFQENLAFEEEAFPQALRDVIGWGAVLQEQIEEDHTRLRQTLATALTALEQRTTSWSELATGVQAFAAELLHDIEREEEVLLNADLDAVATDGAGG